MIATQIICAGLMGAAGVALAAASAHAAPGQGLDGAAYLLVLHAGAVVAGVTGVTAGPLPRFALIGIAAFVVGSALFSGDVALRVLAGHRLFPMAAPTGGVILILAWLFLAVVGIVLATRTV